MLRLLAGRLTYANVMSTLALFVALGGSSYALVRIDGKQLKNRSVSGKKLKRNTLSGTNIKESRLGKVRRARRADHADTLQGFVPGSFRVRCPANTKFNAGVCIERAYRIPAPYGAARVACELAQRRLPTYQELAGVVGDSDIAFAAGGELAAEVYPSSTGDLPSALVVTTVGGRIATTPDSYEGRKAFRCVALPSN